MRPTKPGHWWMWTGAMWETVNVAITGDGTLVIEYPGVGIPISEDQYVDGIPDTYWGDEIPEPTGEPNAPYDHIPFGEVDEAYSYDQWKRMEERKE